ncbi:MAG TPA: hypothetical protein VKV21_00495 [Solirubrobacteraceae bacterium]|nr:hypothetical protein [Solirubrobacteraceae bacterium]
MKMRHLLAALLALLELPLLLPLAAGAAGFGALGGLQSSVQRLRRLVVDRRRPSRRPRAQMLRPAAG